MVAQYWHFQYLTMNWIISPTNINGKSNRASGLQWLCRSDQRGLDLYPAQCVIQARSVSFLHPGSSWQEARLLWHDPADQWGRLHQGPSPPLWAVRSTPTVWEVQGSCAEPVCKQTQQRGSTGQQLSLCPSLGHFGPLEPFWTLLLLPSHLFLQSCSPSLPSDFWMWGRNEPEDASRLTAHSPVLPVLPSPVGYIANPYCQA